MYCIVSFLKKSMRSIVVFSLCLCTILSVAVLEASAARPYEKDLEYTTPIGDCEVFVGCSKQRGTVECTKATSGFLMETGRRVYKATPKEGYKFDGWSYELVLAKGGIGVGPLRFYEKGNRKSLGRYTFSEVGNKKVPYNGTDAEIQLNRLSSCGELADIYAYCKLQYVIVANFSKI